MLKHAKLKVNTLVIHTALYRYICIHAIGLEVSFNNLVATDPSIDYPASWGKQLG